jgi:hypothetical protein
VEVGIDRVYALLKNHPGLDGRPDPSGQAGPDGRPLLIRHDPARPFFEVDGTADGAPALIDDLEAYARVLDENDEPTERIEDKETWHRLDALRYLAAGLTQPAPEPARSHVSSPMHYRPAATAAVPRRR